MIHRANIEHVNQIVDLHLRSLGSTPNSIVGRWLIHKLYLTVIKSRNVKVFIYEDYGKVLGFISVSNNLKELSKQISRTLNFFDIFRIIFRLIQSPSALIAQLKHRLFKMYVDPLLPKTYMCILTIAVDENYRRMKIGTKLIRQIDKLVVKRNPTIFVDTYTNNIKALDFYQKSGYQKVYTVFGNTLLEKKI
jgi:ribosomal protein S18 acetylase RimI-like enzyme